MPDYEEMIIVKPEADVNQVQELFTRLEKLIVSKGGLVKNNENLGVKTLAYPVKKYAKGKYYLLRFSAPGSIVTELSELTRYNSNVLRFLVMEATLKTSSSADKGVTTPAPVKKEAEKVAAAPLDQQSK